MVNKEFTQVKSKSSEDLGSAFVALHSRLRNYLLRHISDPAVAEDLIQDVFTKALAATSANRAPENLTGWLYAVTRTMVADHYRSAQPATLELDENLADDQEASDEILFQELSTCLRPLLQQLPEIYRDTLLATDFNGRTMASVAEELGLSQSAIKSRASRGRVMLKEKLLECCYLDISEGVVTDYHLHPSSCENGCGASAK